MTKLNINKLAKSIQKLYISELTDIIDYSIGQISSCEEADLYVIKSLEQRKRPGTLLAPSEQEARYLENYIACGDLILNSRVPTLNHLENELRAINNHFYKVSGDSAESLSITTKEIYMEDVRFGRFSFGLPDNIIIHDGRDIEQIAEAHDPNEVSGYYHPHVDCCGTICLGDNNEILSNALAGARLLDYFTIIEAILTNYGTSPFQDIACWSGYQCCDCGESYGEDNIYSCINCENFMCSDCLNMCKECEYTLCSDCLVSCNCNSVVCRACTDNCSDCQCELCSSCKKDCGHCEGCCQECKECGRCEDCECE